MPPKRKAMADTSGNNSHTTERNAKVSKTTSSSLSSNYTAPKTRATTRTKSSSTGGRANNKKSKQKQEQVYKYCNANTLSQKKPTYENLQWPNIADFVGDEEQDIPQDGQLMDEFWCNRVSDLGFPVSKEGIRVLDKLAREQGKRDQDQRGMCVYNDWNGWGMSELMENFLKDFNKDIFKKNVSPFKKWTYIEGLACFLKTADLMEWMGNEDGERTSEIGSMLGLMLLTSYSMLSEHSLFKSSSPSSSIKNIGIITLLLLEFLIGPATDLDCGWGCEVVRLCDEAGIELDNELRKQVDFTEENLVEMREDYRKKKTGCGVDLAADYGSDGYKAFAEMGNDWSPEDDVDEEGEGKMWLRWDWELEFKEFWSNHRGGDNYDLSKWSKSEREEYTLGTKAFKKRISLF
ncbi:hypothetical protein G7Y89_g8636 [Cudoniella acicularis]|uniref:Uncharacterized protein n=1 Tax=Cudoniella acicularis TaxID=354080 RepID=A0A8H4RJX1_9HELO|nr:hypothetical protein G7Y89_g8636 [Cudoniella acicularis]